ncbi:MAG: AAA family ATPase [Gammaproteobacteria bacterium]|nr:AAA family ATPase [Gammaproteobacteria bacterium]MDH5260373.1 AAA family ATPase [Gammaproteobacteria bacterium]MDH5582947.1 AAA family ATPase [Gammaproteobacteria bacterium]
MSYLEHFELTEQPFRLTPDPEFLYWSKQHARAKAYMESTIWLADGFVVITGEIGSGKTTLLQSFLSELDDDVIYAVVSQTQLSPTQFLQAILTEFGFKPFNKRKVELLDMLNMFLIEQYSNGKKVVLIVDEAQNLSTKVLEEIRLISGIETHKEKVLRIILAGQPELKETLDSPGMKQLVQRVRLRFHIGPLDRRETREYIERRLAIGGHKNPDLFADDSFEVIYRFSGGVPRLINTLCDTALLCAFADEKKVIEAIDIIAAAEELNWQEHESITGVYEQLRQLEKDLRRDQDSYVTRIEIRTDDELVDVLNFPLGRVIVGRSPDNEVYIKSKFVSRHHAQLVSDESGCVVEDLNSTNGVFLGEKQVKKYRLRDGDKISLGVHELTYHDLRRNSESDSSVTINEEINENDSSQDSAVNET